MAEIKFYKQNSMPTGASPEGVYFVQTAQNAPFRLFVVHSGVVVPIITPGLQSVTESSNSTDQGFLMKGSGGVPDMHIGIQAIVQELWAGQSGSFSKAIIFYEEVISLACGYGLELLIEQTPSVAGANFGDNRVKASAAINQNELPVYSQIGVTSNIRRDDNRTVNLLPNDGTIICERGEMQVIDTSAAVPGRIYRIVGYSSPLGFGHTITFADGNEYNEFDAGTVLQIQYEQANDVWWEVSGNPLPL